jgi:hypothetical protein
MAHSIPTLVTQAPIAAGRPIRAAASSSPCR